MRRLLIISDFNVQNLAQYLSRNDSSAGAAEILQAPFGFHQQVLMNPEDDVWKKGCDAALVWTTPGAVCGSFLRTLQGAVVELDELRRDVKLFAKQILSLKDRVKSIFVPTWVLSPWSTSNGLLDWTQEHGVARRINCMNMWLAESLDGHQGIYMLDTQRWILQAGSSAFDIKMWYLAKAAFGNQTFKVAAHDILSALEGIYGQSRKCVILDLDDTLWGGIIGDMGWEKLRLGGHDPVGEAFVDFQKALKTLTQRGVILAIVSKNTESVAFEGIDQHPEMILRRKDFAGWKINWSDKANNVTELLRELNLGPQSAVFIDDNPVERTRVREACPEVLVPEWPSDKLQYVKALSELRCFQTVALSEEDQNRTNMYLAEKRRQSEKGAIASIDEWLQSLEQEVVFESVSSANFDRTLQLLNKTNQMNLRTRRLTDSELKDWLQIPANSMWVCRVKDKFGDAGLTGIVGTENVDGVVRLSDYVLSCRVMGRRVEESLLYVAISHALQRGARKFIAELLPTAKNKPCEEFFVQKSKLQVNEAVYTWDMKKEYPLPASIQIALP